MRALNFLGAGFVALALGGCLVSETPVLDARNGKALPLNPGPHFICGLTEDGEAEDCELFAVLRDDEGGFVFLKEGEDPTHMRFRRFARNAYAAQSAEDDAYLYYYAAGGGEKLVLVMMNCPDLPQRLRDRLIDRNHLEAEENDFNVCTVKTLAGLTAAAKAYHRGEAMTTGDTIRFVIVRAEAGAAAPLD